jgi:hypothetical protein
MRRSSAPTVLLVLCALFAAVGGCVVDDSLIEGKRCDIHQPVAKQCVSAEGYVCLCDAPQECYCRKADTEPGYQADSGAPLPDYGWTPPPGDSGWTPPPVDSGWTPPPEDSGLNPPPGDTGSNVAIPDDPTICKPCTVNDDCPPDGQKTYLCIWAWYQGPSGPPVEESYCARRCGTLACPNMFLCETLSGSADKVCMPQPYGVCALLGK